MSWKLRGLVRWWSTTRVPARSAAIDSCDGSSDVAALAVHIMTNTALTGATYDIDGGQQLLSNRGGSR